MDVPSAVDCCGPAAPRPCRSASGPEGVVIALAVYPAKGEPGRTLRQATVTGEGLLGDRPKRHALLVVSEEEQHALDDRGLPVRANVVVAVGAAALTAAQGRELRLGEAVVRLDRRPTGCPGLYAEVVEPGEILLGDQARLE